MLQHTKLDCFDLLFFFMITGVAGSDLRPSSMSSLSTYFSRDAGVSWEYVQKGSYRSQFANGASIILFTDASGNIKTIK